MTARMLIRRVTDQLIVAGAYVEHSIRISEGPFAGMILEFCPNNGAQDYEDEAEAVFTILKVNVMFWSDACTIYVDDRELAEMRDQLDAYFRCAWRPDEPLITILKRARIAAAKPLS